MHLVGFLQPRITMRGTTNMKSKVFVAPCYCNIKSIYTNIAIHRIASLLSLRRQKLIYLLYKHSVRTLWGTQYVGIIRKICVY